MADGGGCFPILGAALNRKGDCWELIRWTCEGFLFSGNNTNAYDLIPYAPTETWLIECPAGQTPICFVPTGEVRPPVEGDIALFGKNISYVRNDCCDSPYPILHFVTPVKVER